MKIEYNKDGWVCNRYPYDLTDVFGEIDVDAEQYNATLCTPPHYSWRVVDGCLVNERYEETPSKELIDFQIKNLKSQLAATDYQAIKYSEGRMTEEEYAPISQQRQAWRDEINNLEKELSS